MTLLSNITIPQDLQDRIDGNTLTIADHLILTLANFTASMFPNSETHIGAQQQEVDTPALFVDFYSVKSSKRLANTDEFMFGIEITYVPSEPAATYEMQSAIFTIQQNLFRLESDVGVFSCYDKDSDITDGLAHVTGIVKIGQIDVPTEPIITKAQKEVNL